MKVRADLRGSFLITLVESRGNRKRESWICITEAWPPFWKVDANFQCFAITLWIQYVQRFFIQGFFSISTRNVPLLSPAQNIDYWFKSIHTKNVSLCSWYLCLWHLHDKIVLKKIDKTIISVRYLSYAHSFQAKIYFHLDWYSYQYNFVLIYLHFYYFIKICTCRVRFSNLPQYFKGE